MTWTDDGDIDEDVEYTILGVIGWILLALAAMVLTWIAERKEACQRFLTRSS